MWIEQLVATVGLRRSPHRGLTLPGHKGLTLPGHRGLTLPGHRGLTLPGHRGLILSGHRGLTLQAPSYADPHCSHHHHHHHRHHVMVSIIKLHDHCHSYVILMSLLWCRSDGLEALQESQMKKKQEGGKAGSKEEEGKAAKHNLNWTVHLLAACRKDELEKLEKWQGVPRCVAMYRCAHASLSLPQK